MKQFTLTLHGTRPLLQHNVRLVDPLDEWTQRLAKATDVAKSKKTDDAYRDAADTEWLGAVYHDDQLGPYVKAEAIERCFRQAAATGFRGDGKKIERGVLITATDQREAIPLLYQGPRNLDGLLHDQNFRLRAAVKVGQARVMRTRPRFPNWEVECLVFLDESQINPARFMDIARYAGQYIGIGDHRPRYGRFEVEE